MNHNPQKKKKKKLLNVIEKANKEIQNWIYSIW